MKVVTAPEYYVPTEKEITVFLAGGITNCENWQKAVIDHLRSLPEKDTNRLVIFNPRRDKWPENGDVEEIRRQVNWECDYIRISKIFSMYFTNTKESDQPICFYELGRYARRHNDVISYQQGFKRSLDVELQLANRHLLSLHGRYIPINRNVTPIEHAEIIFDRYEQLIRSKIYNRDYCSGSDMNDEADYYD